MKIASKTWFREKRVQSFEIDLLHKKNFWTIIAIGYHFWDVFTSFKPIKKKYLKKKISNR